ncbi:hypothetical protein DL96DRAFT_1591408 [Flagelloscypha sp. PMI_526]|nr:hypothetical protein DL96DRAFT_1591408 [Flagelloscypha sp. PMI_526]
MNADQFDPVPIGFSRSRYYLLSPEVKEHIRLRLLFVENARRMNAIWMNTQGTVHPARHQFVWRHVLKELISEDQWEDITTNHDEDIQFDDLDVRPDGPPPKLWRDDAARHPTVPPSLPIPHLQRASNSSTAPPQNGPFTVWVPNAQLAPPLSHSLSDSGDSRRPPVRISTSHLQQKTSNPRSVPVGKSLPFREASQSPPASGRPPISTTQESNILVPPPHLKKQLPSWTNAQEEKALSESSNQVASVNDILRTHQHYPTPTPSLLLPTSLTTGHATLHNKHRGGRPPPIPYHSRPRLSQATSLGTNTTGLPNIIAASQHTEYLADANQLGTRNGQPNGTQQPQVQLPPVARTSSGHRPRAATTSSIGSHPPNVFASSSALKSAIFHHSLDLPTSSQEKRPHSFVNSHELPGTISYSTQEHLTLKEREVRVQMLAFNLERELQEYQNILSEQMAPGTSLESTTHWPSLPHSSASTSMPRRIDNPASSSEPSKEWKLLMQSTITMQFRESSDRELNSLTERLRNATSSHEKSRLQTEILSRLADERFQAELEKERESLGWSSISDLDENEMFQKEQGMIEESISSHNPNMTTEGRQAQATNEPTWR